MKKTTLALTMAISLAGAPAIGQTRTRWEPGPATTPGSALSPTASLLGHVGIDAAIRLMRSSDPDERLRGVQRLAAMHTNAALDQLVRATHSATGSTGPGGLDPRLPPEGVARQDPRALLAAVRGLAGWMADATPRSDDRARTALADVVSATNDSLMVRGSGAAPDDGEWPARVLLAKEEAAIALARSADPIALERLVALARSGTAGQDPALLALSIHPPSSPAPLGGVALTTPATVTLAARIGDLRSLDAILGVLRASDPALRAAAIVALGVAGDTRAIEPAQALLHDPETRVRVAAAEALARLGTADAAEAVEGLVADDETALEGLRIAQLVQGEGVVKAAAARAVASADPQMRAAAVAALGRQASPSAVRALAALVESPARAEAVPAIARSPSPAAMGAIETLAGGDPASKRLAARAYFVRRFVRGDRSKTLDALLVALATSRDARDRVVAAEALVALGEGSLEASLADADPHVRRAAALGALGTWSPRVAARLEARAAVEPEARTRTLLALAWMDPAEIPNVPTTDLAERAKSGGPDAPLAASALAARADEKTTEAVDGLLRARDPRLRAYTARGLGSSAAADATGRLAGAYAWESDASVRRAIVTALALRPDAAQEVARPVLEIASRLDPDAVVRWTASSALTGGRVQSSADAPAVPREVAWLSLTPAEGSAPPLDLTARLVDAEGRAYPIAFDEEGFALVPGISPGTARVQLAPELPAYSAPAP